jgi:ribonuclease HII
MSPVVDPTLEVETALHDAGARFVIGCDEVGRGAIAGPVAVGLAVVDRGVGPHPMGLRDSKMLTEPRRELMAPLAEQWALQTAVGLASPLEVDQLGIIAALGLAGKRALIRLHELGIAITQSVVLLDGSHDWLSIALASPPRVQTRVKADAECASVAAASVVAKVHRDRLMIAADAEHSGYDWRSNKGYGSQSHYAAIAALGPTRMHRLTWLKESSTSAVIA